MMIVMRIIKVTMKQLHFVQRSRRLGSIAQLIRCVYFQISDISVEHVHIPLVWPT
jgi:hypothetical protein